MRALPLLLAATLVLAGCLGTAPAGDESPTTTATPTATATPGDDGPTPTGRVAGTDCENAPTPAFWGRQQGIGWERDAVRVGYTVPAETTVFIVALVDGERHGVTTESAGEHAVAVDGAEVELDRRFSGEHTVEVVAYRDTDGDGSFDPSADDRCAGATTGERTVDFDRFAGNDS